MTQANYAAQKAKEAQDAIDEIVAAGAQSGTVSSGGGSESYTRLRISELEQVRDGWLRRYRRAIGTRRHGAANLS
jgi:hypothetical protein